MENHVANQVFWRLSMRVGDLVKYRWWVDWNGADGAPFVDSKTKAEQIGVLLSMTASSHSASAGYVQVHFRTPRNVICDVPIFKIETINQGEL
jgi:hypothetical protein